MNIVLINELYLASYSKIYELQFKIEKFGGIYTHMVNQIILPSQVIIFLANFSQSKEKNLKTKLASLIIESPQFFLPSLKQKESELSDLG